MSIRDSEKSIIDFIKDMESGRSIGKKMMLDPKTGKMVVVSDEKGTVLGGIEVDCDEGVMFAQDKRTVVLLQETINQAVQESRLNPCGMTQLSLEALDNFEVFRVKEGGSVHGFFYLVGEKGMKTEQSGVHLFYNEVHDEIKAYFAMEDKWECMEVIIPPVKEELFSRINGIYETDALADKRVMMIGLGSGGSPVAAELVKQGVQKLVLVDPDRLETSNISRHICGICDLGRYKTKAVADVLKNKNPFADIVTYEADITKIPQEKRKELMKDVDLVICGTDNRESRLLVNRLCIEYGITCIYGGAFRRAYGGQVLRVIPHQSLCYQCFISQLSWIDEDREISNQDQVDRVAYSDIPSVPIEPGLSTDIAPISTFVAKLAIMELLKKQEHTMKSLYEDFSADLYLWFNRREPGTPWSSVLQPMGKTTDQMSIMRWYGVDTKRNECCPVCGTMERSEIEEKNYKLFSA